MRIVVTGGTGFLGRALVEALRHESHQVIVLTRRAPRRTGELSWRPSEPAGEWTRSVEAANAVINLAGESIGAKRWTPSRKQAIRASRLEATQTLVAAMRETGSTAALLSGSAIGYYGVHGDEALDESSPAGDDFLASVCHAWEQEALAAATERRVVLLRSGLVLGSGGGALAPLVRPFRFFVGGPLGSGRQVMSWIHLHDWIELVRWALGDGALAGPLNLTAPNPVSNREMARAIGRALHRPALLKAPAFALRLLVGELADTALLNGQRVVPRVALDRGFTFRYPLIDEALGALYPRRGPE